MYSSEAVIRGRWHSEVGSLYIMYLHSFELTEQIGAFFCNQKEVFKVEALGFGEGGQQGLHTEKGKGLRTKLGFKVGRNAERKSGGGRRPSQPSLYPCVTAYLLRTLRAEMCPSYLPLSLQDQNDPGT